MTAISEKFEKMLNMCIDNAPVRYVNGNKLL
jgi:hypothetical protein